MRALPSAPALLSVAALAATGCEEGVPPQATQVKIEISTNFDCSLLTGVTIALADAEGNLTTVASTKECSNRSVGSLVFIPGDGTSSDDFFIVVVTAGLEIPARECEENGFAGCIVARRRMTFSKDTVDILLSEECVGNSCSFATTCASSGACIPFTTP